MSKLLIIGPSSVHVSNYLELVKDQFSEIVFISSEDILDSELITKQYALEFKTTNPLKILKTRKKLKEILEKENPDIVQIHQVTRHAFISIPIVKKIGKPVVLTAWGSDVLVMPFQNFLYKRLVSKALDKADWVVVDSADMISAVTKLGRAEGVSKILFGIEPIGIFKKENVIYSNRLHAPIYRIETVINLFSEFVKENEGWKLKIGAEGPLTDELKKRVEELGLNSSVEFLGWLNKDQNREVYKKAYIYISIPESDGTSVSVLEAMSAGCVPVLPDIEVTKEWIKDGETGVVFKEGEKNPLISALNLDIDKVQLKNKSLIDNVATKEVASIEYRKIYQTLIK